MVWAEHVLVAVDRVLLEAHGRQLGQELARPGRCRRRNHSPAPGRRPSSSLSSSSRMRSADTISSRSCIAVDRGDQLGHRLQAVAGDEPGRPQHAQRVVAEADSSGRSGVRSACRRRGRRRRRTDRPARASGVSSSAMALTVKSRRDRSASMRVGEHDVGLARVGRVGLGPVGGDLVVRARRAGRRSCRSARPGSTPRRPSRRTIALISSGRASVVRSMSPGRRRGRAAGRGRCRRPGTAGGRRPAKRSASGAGPSSTGAKRSGIIAGRRLRSTGEPVRPASRSAQRSAHGVAAHGAPGPAAASAPPGRWSTPTQRRQRRRPTQSASASRS